MNATYQNTRGLSGPDASTRATEKSESGSIASFDLATVDRLFARMERDLAPRRVDASNALPQKQKVTISPQISFRQRVQAGFGLFASGKPPSHVAGGLVSGRTLRIAIP